MENFTVMPNEVFRDEQLNASEKLIYLYLMTLAGDSGNCFPSYSTISRELGYARSTVCCAIKSLQDKKKIIFLGRKGKNGKNMSNYYLVANRCYEMYSEDLEEWKKTYLSGLIKMPDAVIIGSGDCDAENQGSDNC